MRSEAGDSRPMSKSPTVVRILGASRSGTTIVSKALETLEDAFYLGELDRFADGSADLTKGCVCGMPLDQCPMWSGIEVLPEVGSLDLSSYAAHFDGIYRQLSERTGCSVLIESSKSLPHARRMLRASAFESVLVHVARDPRGVLNSRSRGWKSPRAVGEPSAVDSVRVGLYWNKVNGGIHRLCRRHEDAHFTRYEDFSLAPLEFVGCVGDALGRRPARGAWPSSSSMVVAHGHAAYGNPSRRSTGPSRIRLDDTWQRLPMGARAVAWTASFPMTSKLEYPWRPPVSRPAPTAGVGHE